MNTARHSWIEAIQVYRQRRVWAMMFLGFSAGLPILLVFGTLSGWLARVGVDKTTIGFVSWVALAYGLKVFWSPLVDRLRLPVLHKSFGKRRSWMLVAQCGVILGLLNMAAVDPLNQLETLIWCAIIVAFSSATQDIAIDAWRIEAMPVESQGAMAGTYQLGYRLGMILASGGAFSIAHFYSWPVAYMCMAAAMLVGIVTTLLIAEPDHSVSEDTWKQEQRVIDYMENSAHVPGKVRSVVGWFIGAVVCPFSEFFMRNGKLALAILLFIGLFRISDITMGVMANPLYVDRGYTDIQIGIVAKSVGIVITIFGALIGGVMVFRYGVMKMLMFSAIVVILTNLAFALLAVLPANILYLAVVVGADNLAGGLAGSVFIAYLSGMANRAYTATQYALFSSLMLLPAKFIGGFSGVVVDSFGFVNFFIYSAALGIPAIVLIRYLSRQEKLANRP